MLLAEDHPDVATQLRALLEPEFEVMTTVGDGFAMLGAARALRPDVIVADIAMPLLDGITAAAELLREVPKARVVFVSVHRDAALVQQCMTLGALGYVSKLNAGDELLPALRAALAGRTVRVGVTPSPARARRSAEHKSTVEPGHRRVGDCPGLGKREVPMRGKNIAVLSWGEVLLVTSWLPVSLGTVATTLTVAGGAAAIVGCSPDRSDSRPRTRGRRNGPSSASKTATTDREQAIEPTARPSARPGGAGATA